MRLYCRVSGSPTATITWEKQGDALPPQVSIVLASVCAPGGVRAPRVPLTPTLVPQSRAEHGDIATLIIPAVTMADGGIYLCMGTSAAGTARAAIEVAVVPGEEAGGTPMVFGDGFAGLQSTHAAPFAPHRGGTACPHRVLIPICHRGTDPGLGLCGGRTQLCHRDVVQAWGLPARWPPGRAQQGGQQPKRYSVPCCVTPKHVPTCRFQGPGSVSPTSQQLIQESTCAGQT